MLRIIICDDVKANILALSRGIKGIIGNAPIGGEIEIFSVGPEALMNYKINDSYTYLFILDVIYKNISGLEVARKIRGQHKEAFIIFVTRHIELMYMVINQNIMPSGFIEKPVNENDMRKVILNVFDYYKENNKAICKTLTVSTGSAVYKIPYDEIIYIESMNKKVFIYSDTQRIGCYNSLQTLGSELGEEFIRCHKSFIVNKNKIKNIYFDEMFIEMSGGSRISMSRTYKGNVKKLVQKGDA